MVNALTGAAIPRALVTLNSRTVLSDAEGNFSFPQFQPNGSGVQAYVLAQKPGFAAALNPLESMAQQAVADVTAPLELKLYPDGLISGRVTNARGEPLSKLQVTVFPGERRRHADADAAGRLDDDRLPWRVSLRPAAGHYAVLLRYTSHGDDPEEVVLPVTVSGAK